jgi:hypothetical protein
MILWIVGISGALHLLVFARPDAAPLLWLDPDAVLRGEVWRVVTFLFAPTGPVTGTGLLWTALGLWFIVGPVSGRYVAEALLLAFAVEFPDYEVLLLILPVKVKYLGILSGGLMVYELITGDLASRAAVGVALANFLLFCGPALRSRLRSAGTAPRKVAPAFAPPVRKTRVCAKCGRSEADDPKLEFRVCDCQEKCRGKLTEYCLDHARAH